MTAGRILVGIDGSEASKDALRWAKAYADATSAELVALTAWEYPAAFFPMIAYTIPAGERTGLDADSRAGLQRLVKEIIGDASAELKVVEGNPVGALLDAAEGASLIVVGAHGHGGFVGALVGSVSQQLIAHAPCPVVVVRHPKGQRIHSVDEGLSTLP